MLRRTHQAPAMIPRHRRTSHRPIDDSVRLKPARTSLDIDSRSLNGSAADASPDTLDYGHFALESAAGSPIY